MLPSLVITGAPGGANKSSRRNQASNPNRRLNMADIIHRIGIKASPAQVYAAVATVEGVAGWWTRETTGEAKPGGSMQVRFRDAAGARIGGMTFVQQKLTPDEEVQWRFTAGPEEWLGTDATFHLSRDGDGTIVRFAHRNWRQADEFMAHCSMKWATFLLSLRQLVETGRGSPSPDDLKIDNWN
jgi:uncharacterized protein YndB with AHSA1/START domain